MGDAWQQILDDHVFLQGDFDSEDDEKKEEVQNNPNNTNTTIHNTAADAAVIDHPHNHIAQLPDVIIQFLTNLYLDDASAVAFARTSQLTFRLVKDSYRVRGQVEFEFWCENGNSMNSNLVADSPSLPTRHSISVAFPCLMATQRVFREYPESGQLDWRSFHLPTYAITETENSSSSSFSSRSPHRIGLPDNIVMETPRIDDIDEGKGEKNKAAYVTQTLSESLPATTRSLRIQYASTAAAISSLARLSRLHTFVFDRVESLTQLNVIACLLPQLRVLRLEGVYGFQDHPNSPLEAKENDVFQLPPALEELELGWNLRNLENRIVLHEKLRCITMVMSDHCLNGSCLTH